MKSGTRFKYYAILVIFSITFVSCDDDDDFECDEYWPRDFVYVLTKDIKWHSRQIADVAGLNLTLGSPVPDSAFGQATSSFHCSKLSHNDADYTKSYLDTEVHDRSQRGQEDKVATDKYFILITRKLYKCIDKNEKLPGFLRVVNEMVNARDIEELSFYDGIEMNVTRYVGERVNVRVREIKYIMEGTGSIVRYGGCLLGLESDTDVKVQYIPGFHGAVYLYRDEKTLLAHNRLSTAEVQLPADLSLATSNVLSSQSIWSLVVGSPPVQDNIIEEQPPSTRIKCGKVYMSSPYAAVYRTEVWQEVGVDGKGENILASLDDNLFSKLFVITHRTVHRCQKNWEEPFYRVIQNVIGKVPLKKVTYHRSSIVQMASINVANGVSVLFTEIKFINDKGTALYRYDNSPLLIENGDLPFLWIGYEIDTKYLLQEKPLHLSRTLIGTEGYDLRIGETNHGKTMDCTSGFTELTCMPATLEQRTGLQPWQKMSIWLKAKRDSHWHSLTPIMDEANQLLLFGKPVLEVVTQRIWQCKDTYFGLEWVCVKLASPTSKIYLKMI